MSTLSVERRRFPRFDLECTAQLISPSGDMVITALTSNLSDGGMRIPLPGEALPECGAETLVKLFLRRGKNEAPEKHNGYGTIIRHTSQDEDGVAEAVVKFRKPMSLRLQKTSAVSAA